MCCLRKMGAPQRDDTKHTVLGVTNISSFIVASSDIGNMAPQDVATHALIARCYVPTNSTMDSRVRWRLRIFSPSRTKKQASSRSQWTLTRR